MEYLPLIIKTFFESFDRCKPMTRIILGLIFVSVATIAIIFKKK